MNVEQITNKVILLVERPLSIAYVKQYINEAIQTIAAKHSTAYPVTKSAIICTDTMEDYNLPIDCVGVIAIYDTLNGNSKYTDYTILNNTISFKNEGTYLIKHYKMPPDLPEKEVYDMTIGDDIPEIHLFYHIAIPYFVASKILFTDDTDEAANKSNVFMQTFDDIAKEADAKIVKMKRGIKRLKAPLWR